MLLLRGYKFRLKVKAKHRMAFASQAGCCRFVWNNALEQQESLRKEGKRLLSNFDLNNRLPKLKTEFAFLKDVHSICLQATMRDLAQAIANCFNHSTANKWPVFKKKGKVDDSFRYPQGCKLDHKRSRIFLPKVGYVRYYNSRPEDESDPASGVPGKIKNVTVSRHGRDWFVSIQTEREVKDPVHPSPSTVGIDMGIRVFATLSNGKRTMPKHPFRALEEKLARAQRKLSRKEKGSKNFHKQKIRVNKICTKTANVRRDFLHKTSTSIAKSHGVVFMEDLSVGNMSKSAKGTVENPGKNVSAKSGLNKAILDQGWFMFRTMLDYKLRERGGRLVLVPPQYTSRECPKCHCVFAANRKGPIFRCIVCGYVADADLVGSVNIKAAGLAVLACGGAAICPVEAGTKEFAPA